MGAELIPMAFSTGWGSGINAYLVVLVLGLADRIVGFGQIPDALARTDVLIASGVLFVLEYLFGAQDRPADKRRGDPTASL